MSASCVSDRLTATLALDSAVNAVKGVSSGRAELLNKMGIYTVRDLVCTYPHRYIDLSQRETVLSAPIGAKCTICATVYNVVLKNPKPRLSLVEITVNDGTGTMIVTCFKQPWLTKSLAPHMRLALAGEITCNYGFKRMTNPYIEVLDEAPAPGNVSSGDGVILSVHPACEGISVALMRRLIANALAMVSGLYDCVPLEYRIAHRLPSRYAALEAVHFPKSMHDAALARKRLAYEELLLLETYLLHDAQVRRAGVSAFSHVVDGPCVARLRAGLPFVLTADQEEALRDIFARMAAPRQMSHLLLGDVGTGKTIVAAFVLAAACDSGYGGIVMAPTEVLAQQHAKTLGTLFDAIGISWGFLSGSTTPKARAELLASARAGDIRVLLGTHALLEDDVMLPCSVVIVDEQQRFGVEQRQTLTNRFAGCDSLYLTATPIPRTLALTLYGDLSLSYLREKPHGQARRTTRVLSRENQGDAYDAARVALSRGEQVYVVCPLVGESDETAKIETEADFDARENLSAATKEASVLSNSVFIDYRVGLLHGRLAPADKALIMDAFSRGDIQVLVSTTVIEVGIDVANATVIIIQNAERFGLSQLHQLRGRVGRGEKPGEVFLIEGTVDEIAEKRLRAMERTEDGFELATLDLSLRREGDILGNRQSGTGILKLVNVVRDGDLIAQAHADAETILAADPDLAAPEHGALAREIRVAFRNESVKNGG